MNKTNEYTRGSRWHSRGQRFDIGEGSIVGAGSVVVKPIPPYSLAVGCPAKVIKKREG